MEPIAIIGLGCRFPGAHDAPQFWSSLRGGVESISFFSSEELIAAGVPAAVAEDPNFVRAHPRVPAFDEFDARLFGMTPREARLADPQLRTFMEVSHSAVEDAGYDPYAVPGSVGVFGAVGSMSYNFENLRGHREPANESAIAMMNSTDYLATQVSYRFDYTGPSMTVVTACSSSLTAVHLACQSLRLGECDMALAGGATIEADKLYGYWYVPGGIRSRDGHCRPFDAGANGTVFGSGVGVVVLKRLVEAIADGDHVRAVIRGIGVNNDGSDKVSFGAPSVSGQVACVQDAMASAGVRPQEISYVEAHGTGTLLGDPIEMTALDQAWRGLAEEELATGWCPIGSVKSNMGHAAQAAGVAGLIKVTLGLENGEIPATVNFSAPNPKLEIDKTSFFVADRLLPWSRDPGAPRVAGISSLGVGGTNVHMIVGEAPVSEPTPSVGRPRLVVWSALSEPAAEATRAKLTEHFDGVGRRTFEDSVTTLQRGRKPYRLRRAVVCADADEATRALASDTRVLSGDASDTKPIVFAFPGQGSSFPGMGAGLYGHERVFTETVDACFELFGERGETLRRLWTRSTDPAELTDTAVAQPLLFTIEYALAQTWRAWGVRPELVLGHSLGEFVAATVAGVVDLGDAVRLVGLRGDVMASMPTGAMAAISCSPDKVADRLPAGVSLAAVNSPHETVVAGRRAALDEFVEVLRAEGVKSKILRTSHAFHSDTMAEAAELFERGFAGVRLRPPSIPLLSAATGAVLTTGQAVDPAFWAGQLVRPVLFASAVDSLAGLGDHLLLEMGPGRALSALAGSHPAFRTGTSMAARVLPQPHPQETEPERRTMLAALATAWTQGADVDWAVVDHGWPVRRVPVPGYSYQRERYWIDGPTAAHLGPSVTTPPVATAPEPAAPRPASPPVSAFSVLNWVEQPRQEPGTPRGGVALVLLPADRAVSVGVATSLQQAGFTVFAVRPGAEYVARESEFEIPLNSTDSLRRVLAELTSRGVTVDCVVHAATMPAWEPATAQTVPDQVEASFFSLLSCVKQVAAVARPIRLVVLTTRSADISGSEEVDVVKATLHGQLRTLALEEPRLRVRLVDVGAGTPEEELADELRTVGDGDVVALRGSRRWVRAELPYVPRPGRAPAIRRRGVYLITGGLGGLGLAVAKGLARTGLRPVLILVGRKSTAGAAAVVDDLDALGATVRVVRADVADARELRRALDVACAQFGPVNGVFHLAGVPGDGMLLLRSRERAEEVLRPKVLGTVLLRELFADRAPLDLFVSFSSRASVGGLVGSGDYAAANAFLDALAISDRSDTRTLSINWPSWSTAGMAAAAIDELRDSRGTRWETELDAASTWALDEHRLDGQAVYPGTAHLDAVLRAFRDRFPDRTGSVRFEEVVFHAPLVVAGASRLRVVFTEDGRWHAFRVESRQSIGWQLHVVGRIGEWTGQPRRVDLDRLRAGFRDAGPVGPAAHDGGVFVFGPRWGCLREERRSGAEALLAIELRAEFASDLATHPLHPAVLDVATAGVRRADDDPALPFMYRTLTLHDALPAVVFSHIRRLASATNSIVADIDLVTSDGTVVAEIEGFTMRRFDSESIGDSTPVTPQVRPDGPGIDLDAGVRLLFELLDARTPAQVVVRPFDNGQPVPLTGQDAVVMAPRTPVVPVRQEPPRVPEPPEAVAIAATGADTATRIRTIWEEMLGFDDFADDDDFFEIGGTSLSAIELMTRIRDQFSVELSIAVLLDSPTVAALATAVGG